MLVVEITWDLKLGFKLSHTYLKERTKSFFLSLDKKIKSGQLYTGCKHDSLTLRQHVTMKMLI